MDDLDFVIKVEDEQERLDDLTTKSSIELEILSHLLNAHEIDAIKLVTKNGAIDGCCPVVRENHMSSLVKDIQEALSRMIDLEMQIATVIESKGYYHYLRNLRFLMRVMKYTHDDSVATIGGTIEIRKKPEIVRKRVNIKVQGEKTDESVQDSTQDDQRA